MFLHIETSLLLKQKDNVDRCEICGPGFVVIRKSDTVRHHAKGHAPDSDYIILWDFFFELL